MLSLDWGASRFVSEGAWVARARNGAEGAGSASGTSSSDPLAVSGRRETCSGLSVDGEVAGAPAGTPAPGFAAAVVVSP